MDEAATSAVTGGCPVPHTGRRAFLTAGLGALGVAGLAGCSAARSAAAGGEGAGRDADTGRPRPRRVPFAGVHQSGITATPVPALGALAAFRVTATDRDRLAEMFQELTRTTADLMAGRMPEPRDRAYPPEETGILGPEPAADDLSIVVSVGAGLFDDRFGLADRRPRELVEMPFLANDRLDPERSHGDLLITIEAGHEDTVQHALRQLMRATRAHLLLAWTVTGYARASEHTSSGATPRNLLGFKDGTANLDMTDDDLMNEHVFVQAGDGEPDWAVGGSYHAVRVIRMLVEFWDRAPLAEQEAIFGRSKLSGAPLGMSGEFDIPDYAADPTGSTIALDSHIRLANPRTAQTAADLILRRGLSYTRGVDAVGQLDQGLAFVSFQRDLGRFLRVSQRLKGEPLEEYTRPEGGGFYFALPGVPDERTSLGAGLLG